MAKKSGLGQEFYIHGYDLSGDVGSLDGVGAPRGTLDITAINKSAVERLNGRSDATLSFNTWFNDATEQEHAALSGLLTTDRIVLWAMGGSTGDAACAFPARSASDRSLVSIWTMASHTWASMDSRTSVEGCILK